MTGFFFRLAYFLRAAVANVTQYLVLNLISAITISLALLLLGGFFLIHINLAKLIESAAEGLSVSVYLKDETTFQEAEELQEEIGGIQGVLSVDYISRDQALVDLQARLGDQGRILDGLKENPLPASLELILDSSLRDSGRVEDLINELRIMKGVEEVHFAWEWAEKVQVVMNFIRVGGMVVGSILFFAIVFIIANTIRLTVLARRDELYIMRLVGATDSFIKIPFIIGGVVQGVAGSMLAWSVLFFLFHLLVGQIQSPFGFSGGHLEFLPSSWSWTLVGIGGGLGLIGSWLSLGRFVGR